MAQITTQHIARCLENTRLLEFGEEFRLDALNFGDVGGFAIISRHEDEA